MAEIKSNIVWAIVLTVGIGCNIYQVWEGTGHA